MNTNSLSLSLEQALQGALLHNRQLQIQEISAEFSRTSLQLAYGYYDPLFVSQVRKDNTTDTGGFDPVTFLEVPIFSATSETVTFGVQGFLPTGLSFNLGANYAHSSGVRNFLNFDSYKIGTGLFLDQPLLRNAWIDQPRWQIKVARNGLRISELGVHFLAMATINQAQQAYYDLAHAWEVVQIERELVHSRESFVAAIRRQVELGRLTSLEEKIAQSHLASIQTDLITASNSVRLASNNLRTLMGVESEKWIEQPFSSGDLLKPKDLTLLVPEGFNLQDSWRLALRKRPDFAQLRVDLETKGVTVQFRKNQLLPSLDLVGSYTLRGNDAIQAFPPDVARASANTAFGEIARQVSPSTLVGIIFSIPLTSAKERANYRASKEMRREAEITLKQKEEFMVREIADAIEIGRSSFSRAEAARSAVAFAEDALNAQEQILQGGAGSILNVINAQGDLSRAKISVAVARRDYNKALTQLSFAEGTLLEKNRLRFEIR